MGRRIAGILAALAVLAGVGLLLWPYAANLWADHKNKQTIEQFTETVQTADSAAAPDDSGETDGETAVLPELYAALQEYNARIYAEGQSGLTDPFDYEQTEFDLSAYGLADDQIGSIWVPRLEQELPLYLGASKANLAKGAAVLGQTSMPLGGENTNTVIAAHRGYNGQDMFRDIQELQLGDKIQITTPWGILIYRVCELKIIEPDDVNEILIQPGRDLVTLSTCHPYPGNAQRYLVYAERDPDAEAADKQTDLEESRAAYDTTPRQVTVVDADGTETVAEVAPGKLTALPGEGSYADGETGAQSSNWQIWLEDHILWVVLAAVALLVLAMRPRRRNKR